MARVGERASSVVFCLDFQQKGIIFLLTGVSVRQTYKKTTEPIKDEKGARPENDDLLIEERRRK
jgi:hypothetical protein